MSKRTIGLVLASAVVAGLQVSVTSSVSAQTDVEIIFRDEDVTETRFRDEDGILVERFTSREAGFTEDKFFNEEGDVVTKKIRLLDGTTLTEHWVYQSVEKVGSWSG